MSRMRRDGLAAQAADQRNRTPHLGLALVSTALAICERSLRFSGSLGIQGANGIQSNAPGTSHKALRTEHRHRHRTTPNAQRHTHRFLTPLTPHATKRHTGLIRGQRPSGFHRCGRTTSLNRSWPRAYLGKPQCSPYMLKSTRCAT